MQDSGALKSICSLCPLHLVFRKVILLSSTPVYSALPVYYGMRARQTSSPLKSLGTVDLTNSNSCSEQSGKEEKNRKKKKTEEKKRKKRLIFAMLIDDEHFGRKTEESAP